MNTGEVVVRSITTGQGHTEYTPIGHTTNLASRMQALAPTGSIAISESTRKLAEGYFALRPLGPTKVKGVTEPINVYEVVGLGPLRTRLQRSAGRGLTKFVGREREMEAMRNAAELARAGRGQIVAAMAEAGTGKSRLFFEFKAKNHNYFRITSDDDARARREKVAGKVAILDRSLEDALPYLFGLLGIVEGDDPLAQMDGQIKKRRTLDAIKRLLLRESLNQPLMVIFEDLHWIDEQTQEFLNLLADSIGTAKILLLVNYRPEYSHQWGSKTYYTQLRLDPLGKESADEMLSALLGDGVDVAPLKRVIIEKTEGNPFFMEETVQVLLDEGALVREGSAVRLTRPVSELKIPPTVQGILAARIDRLPADEKDLLQTLAVIGKEFALSLVRSITGRPDDDLGRMLNDLQLAEFIYEQPAMGDIEYTFKHALTQEVAYNSVLVERRRQFHERIGTALETLYASSLDGHLAELAHHFSRGNNPEKAVLYLALAGKHALERFSYGESQAQLQKGLELLKTLPESAERDATELDLVSALAQVLISISGLTAPELIEATARARTLAEKTGNLSQLIVQLSRIRASASGSGDHLRASAVADQMLELAELEGSPVNLAQAHFAQLMARFYRGDLPGAEEHFGRLIGFGEVAGLRQPLQGIIAMNAASISAWISGHAENARERIARSMTLARDSRNPTSMAFGRYFESVLYRHLREAHSVEASAAQSLATSEEHGFRTWSDMARISIGWARAQLGSAGEGIALIRQGLAGLEETGTRLWLSDLLTCLAEAQALDGAIGDALGTIDDAFVANPGEHTYRPNILTCRGELRLKIGKPELAEADFRDAIALAQKMSAKAWELRATTSLARLLRDTNRRDEARAMLAQIYNWFTEGFDTADLKDAKALLEELRQ